MLFLSLTLYQALLVKEYIYFDALLTKLTN